MPSDSLLIKMRVQADKWEQQGDHRFVFLRCYLMMTANMVKAIGDGQFRDKEWVSHLLHRFADYYFDALRLYEAQDESTPAVWKQVHDASRDLHLHVLQHLLLGINAHINYDLVLAIYDAMTPDWKNLTEVSRQTRMADHNMVNLIIGSTIDSVQDLVIEREAPFMKIVDSLMGRVDEWLLSELITSWRTQVWEESCAMLAANHPDDKESMRWSLEEKVMNRAVHLLGF